MFAFLASQSQSVTVTIEISTDLSTLYTTTSDSPTKIFFKPFSYCFIDMVVRARCIPIKREIKVKLEYVIQWAQT